MAETVIIGTFLREAGFDTPAAAARARAVLETRGLTRPGKQRMAGYKVPEAEHALAEALVRVCDGACANQRPRDRRERVIVSAASCELCRGSNNQRAALAAGACLERHGVRNLLIVGGSDSQVDDVVRLFSRFDVSIERVDGTRRSHTKKSAMSQMNRAQLMVIWGPTPLRHAVSDLFTSGPPQHLRVVSVSRRGIEALCQEIVESFRRSG